MKVRVCFTVNITDELRRAIRARYGLDGLATRKEIQSWYIWNSEAYDEDTLADWAADEREEPNPR